MQRTLYSTRIDSPLGPLTLASDGQALVGLWLEGQKYFAATVNDPVREDPNLPIFTVTKNWLDAYFAGKQPAIAALPLAPKGSEFRQTVWDILCAIPYGQYTTYGAIAGQVAARLNKAMSGRAVGGAVGHNPVSIVIPCHRVIGKGGGLTGYAGGIDKKIALLRHEGVDISLLH